MVELPEGWFWSYKISDKNNGVSACAIRFVEKTDVINGEFVGLFDESFATGKSIKEAEKKVIENIKRGKIQRRWIFLLT